MTFKNALILTFLWFHSCFTPWPAAIAHVGSYWNQTYFFIPVIKDMIKIL